MNLMKSMMKHHGSAVNVVQVMMPKLYYAMIAVTTDVPDVLKYN